MSTAGQQARRAERTAQQAAESGPIKTLGRVGLIAYGVVHLLVAYLAVRVALGGGGKADKTGALQTIAEQPAGRFFLWVLTVGLVALTIWQLAEAGWGHGYRRPRRKRTIQRLVSLGEAGVAGALAYSSFKVASGKGGKSKGEKAAFVDKIFDWPAGELLVAVIGLGIVAIACTWSTGGRQALRRRPRPGRGRAARPGRRHPVRAGGLAGPRGRLRDHRAAAGLLGGHLRPQKATGMDTALKTLAGQPYGTVLLLIVAAGLACFGAYCLFDARYRRG